MFIRAMKKDQAETEATTHKSAYSWRVGMVFPMQNMTSFHENSVSLWNNLSLKFQEYVPRGRS